MARPVLALATFFVLLGAVPAQEPSTDPAPPASTWATVTHDNVRVRAGTADYNAEVARVNRGDVVEVVGRHGDWAEVRLPGGTVAYVKKSASGRPYVEQKGPGEGLVVVRNLMLRPLPTTDWPAMGKLRANQLVTILGEETDGWYRILAPDGHTVFIFDDYLDHEGDQAALAKSFASRDQVERQRLLASGEISSQALEHVREMRTLEQRLEAAHARLEKILDGPADAAALSEIRSEYEAIAAAAPKDSAVAGIAHEKATYVRGREVDAKDLKTAEVRIDELEKQLKENESRYTSELTRIRKERKQRLEAAAAKPDESSPLPARFLKFGIGRIIKDPLKSAGGVATFVLRKGAERRYLLSSVRYDLSEYVDKEIGITGWTIIDDAPVDRLRKVEVTRLEILD